MAHQAHTAGLAQPGVAPRSPAPSIMPSSPRSCCILLVTVIRVLESWPSGWSSCSHRNATIHRFLESEGTPVQPLDTLTEFLGHLSSHCDRKSVFRRVHDHVPFLFCTLTCVQGPCAKSVLRTEHCGIRWSAWAGVPQDLLSVGPLVKFCAFAELHLQKEAGAYLAGGIEE